MKSSFNYGSFRVRVQPFAAPTRTKESKHQTNEYIENYIILFQMKMLDELENYGSPILTYAM